MTSSLCGLAVAQEVEWVIQQSEGRWVNSPAPLPACRGILEWDTKSQIAPGHYLAWQPLQKLSVWMGECDKCSKALWAISRLEVHWPSIITMLTWTSYKSPHMLLVSNSHWLCSVSTYIFSHCVWVQSQQGVILMGSMCQRRVTTQRVQSGRDQRWLGNWFIGL